MASERSVGLGIESVVDLDRVPWDRRRVPTNPVTEATDNRLGLSCGNDADVLGVQVAGPSHPRLWWHRLLTREDGYGNLCRAGEVHRHQGIRDAPRPGSSVARTGLRWMSPRGPSTLKHRICLDVDALQLAQRAVQLPVAGIVPDRRVPLVFLNSISFYDTEVNLARAFRRAQTRNARRVHKKRGCDHATGQASFEEETHNQGRRRDGAGCGRSGSFAVR